MHLHLGLCPGASYLEEGHVYRTAFEELLSGKALGRARGVRLPCPGRAVKHDAGRAASRREVRERCYDRVAERRVVRADGVVQSEAAPAARAALRTLADARRAHRDRRRLLGSTAVVLVR